MHDLICEEVFFFYVVLLKKSCHIIDSDTISSESRPLPIYTILRGQRSGCLSDTHQQQQQSAIWELC